MSAIQSMASSAISLAQIRASPSKLKSMTTVSRMAHTGRRSSLGQSNGGGSNQAGGRRRRSSAEHQITARITRQASRLARQRGGSGSGPANHSSGMLRRSARLGGPASLQAVHGQHNEHNRTRSVASRGLDVDPMSVQSRLRRSVRIARQSRGRSRQSQLTRGPTSTGNSRNHSSRR